MKQLNGSEGNENPVGFSGDRSTKPWQTVPAMNAPRQKRMTALEAAFQVLKEAGEPLDAAGITRRILEQDLWKTNGKTPARTVTARIGEEITRKGADSRFKRIAKHFFTLTKPSPPTP